MIALVADRSRTMECYAHKGMAGFIAEMAHHRISITSHTVVTMHTRCPIRETKRLFDFLPVGIEKIAVGMCP